MITIPEYFSKYINNSIDLNTTPKVCCPFHQEDTPSFSYSALMGKWRCFGACHVGGDVIALHQKHKHLKNRQEAYGDLCKLEGYDAAEVLTLQETKSDNIQIDDVEVMNSSIYNSIIFKLTKPEQWIELDQIMSEYPIDQERLKEYGNSIQ